jgi:two-component system chemotaxis response regulator CheB
MSHDDPILRTPEAFHIIVVGASAGAVEALLAILPKLPADYPLPLALVVHVPPGRESLLPELLGSRCAIQVKEAEDKEHYHPGVLYLAPPDYHLLLERGGYFSLSNDEPVMFSRPSIDVLFESAANAWGSRVVGVVLTGANEDGARGLEAICACGGLGLVQDPTQAEAPRMPAAASAACPAACVASLEKIADLLQALPFKRP